MKMYQKNDSFKRGAGRTVDCHASADSLVTAPPRPRGRSIAISLLGLLFALATLSTAPADARMQEEPVIDVQGSSSSDDVTAAAAPPQSAEGIADIQAGYDDLLTRLSEVLKELNTARTMYRTLPRAEALQWRTKYEDAMQRGTVIQKEFGEQAAKLFAATEQPDELSFELVLRVVKSRFDEGRYEDSLELNGKLIERLDQFETTAQPDKLVRVRALVLQFSALAMTNRIDEMLLFLNDNAEFVQEEEIIQSVQEDALENYKMFSLLLPRWARESELREKDKTANLPIVEIETTRGTITCLLFEDQAPLAVNNFISLAERGHFTDKVFHRVINHFMAQAGGTAPGEPAQRRMYSIADEHHLPESRHHFRGSLCMARTQQPNSASTEFYITFAPKPGLDHFPDGPPNNGYTVFGMVTDGWDALNALNRTHRMISDEEQRKEVAIPGAECDRIKAIRVIRKRDHEYTITPFSGDPEKIWSEDDHGHDH